MFITKRPSVSQNESSVMKVRGNGAHAEGSSNGSIRPSIIRRTGLLRSIPQSALTEVEEQKLRDDIRDLQGKLEKAINLISLLETKQLELQDVVTKSAKQYQDLKEASLKAIWGFTTQNSHKFANIPRIDAKVFESESAVGDFNLVDIVGTGRFATVFSCQPRSAHASRLIPNDASDLARHQHQQQQQQQTLAVKVICKERMVAIDEILKVEGELKALTYLRGHKNIVEFKQCIHSADKLYVFTELMPSDLKDFLLSYRHRLDDNALGCILREIVEGLVYMHSEHIIHRDLKPENVLIVVSRNDIKVKICDLSLAKFLPPNNSFISDFAGSPGFFAPETMLQGQFCGYLADMFSLGCLALELLSSQVFFNSSWMLAYCSLSDVDAPEFNRKIRAAVQRAHNEIEGNHQVGVADFVANTLNTEADNRLTAVKARCHQWLIHTNKFTAADVINCKDPRRAYVKQVHVITSPTGRNGEQKKAGAVAHVATVPALAPIPSPIKPMTLAPGRESIHTDNEDSDDGTMQPLNGQMRLAPITPRDGLSISETPPANHGLLATGGVQAPTQASLSKALSKTTITKSSGSAGKLLSASSFHLERGLSFVAGGIMSLLQSRRGSSFKGTPQISNVPSAVDRTIQEAHPPLSAAASASPSAVMGGDKRGPSVSVPAVSMVTGSHASSGMTKKSLFPTRLSMMSKKAK